jgi:hypothetical protein
MKTPAAAGLGLRIEELPPRRRALFEAMLRERQAARPDGLPIPRRQETGPCPLSFAQERLWFLHQLDPGRPRRSRTEGML